MKLYKNNELIDILDKILDKKGILLSDPKLIKSKRSNIIIKCLKCEREWITQIRNIENRWCANCYGNLRKTINDVIRAEILFPAPADKEQAKKLAIELAYWLEDKLVQEKLL